jgi:hypothetical protein
VCTGIVHNLVVWCGRLADLGPVNAIETPLRANIDETVLPVIITEQGENRNQCEEQRYVFDFSHGFACR